MPLTEKQDPERGKLLNGGPSKSPRHRPEWRRELQYRVLKLESRTATQAPFWQTQADADLGHGDSSGPLFTMYSKLAVEEDNKMAERWQKDAEGIIIFTGLFSAVVTALVVVSIQDLRPNPQDTSSFYLEKLYQSQANPNVSNTSFHSIDVKPPTFSPPRYAIWVNSLWVLSLVISLTCAMLATLLQQWARRYIRTTQLARRTPRKRAQIRAFFANGVDRFHVASTVEALPALVHLSLFFFFSGLLVFLFNVNRSVFIPVFCWVAASLGVYTWVTVVPIFCHDSPYYAPLSSTIWLLYTTTAYIILAVLTLIPFRDRDGLLIWGRFRDSRDRYREWIRGGIGKAAEKTTSEQASKINSRIVEWTADALGEDDALEKFLEAIPGFYQFEVTENLQVHLPKEVQDKIAVAAGKFLNRTLSSGSAYKPVIEHLLAACLNAADIVGGSPGVAMVLRTMVDGNWHGGPQAVEIGHFLMRWVKGTIGRGQVMGEVHCVVALIIKSVRERDDHWKALTLDHLGVSEGVLENYLAHGNSVLLANLVCVIRLLAYSRWEWTPLRALQLLSTFNIYDILSELQDDFCVMWNKYVIAAREPALREFSPHAVGVLFYLRRLFKDLHPDSTAAAFSDTTDSLDDILFQPSSYSLCRGQHPVLTDIGETPRAFTSSPLNLPPDDSDSMEASVAMTPTRSGTSSIISSHDRFLPVPLVNPVQFLDPDMAVTTQATGEDTTILSTPTGPSSHPSVPHLHSSTSLYPHIRMRRSPQHVTGCHAISPFDSPGMSTSLSLPSLLPGNTRPSDLRSFPRASASQAATKSLPNVGHPSLIPTDNTPPINL